MTRIAKDRSIADAIEALECYANRIIGCINNLKMPIGNDDWTDVSLNAYHNLEFDYQTFLIFIERYEDLNIRVLLEVLDKTVSSILILVNENTMRPD